MQMSETEIVLSLQAGLLVFALAVFWVVRCAHEKDPLAEE